MDKYDDDDENDGGMQFFSVLNADGPLASETARHSVATRLIFRVLLNVFVLGVLVFGQLFDSAKNCRHRILICPVIPTVILTKRAGTGLSSERDVPSLWCFPTRMNWNPMCNSISFRGGKRECTVAEGYAFWCG